jgi:predicted DNA-binding transcriptional regulator AlpA
MSLNILTEEDVLRRKLAGASTGTLHALMNDPEDPFPPPISITARKRGWNELKVDAWLEGRQQRQNNEAQRRADIAARMPQAAAAAAASVASRRRRAGQTDAGDVS